MVIAKDWPENWIDLFLLANLEREGLGVSPDADPVTLVRRLSFDLTGLPPAPETVAAFVRDSSPEAYERLVDDLLASEAYGERMAMYWLDLVRYADTVGYHGDQDHNISPYRDYVIDAFNDNLPFDQLHPRATRRRPARRCGHATSRSPPATTACCRRRTKAACSPRSTWRSMRPIASATCRPYGWAATLGCAQCHDHKYDPYTTQDFYSMAAFFADIDEARTLSTRDQCLADSAAARNPGLSRRERQRIAELEQQLQTLADQPGTDDYGI